MGRGAAAVGADTLDAAAARSGRAVDLRARAFLPLGTLFVIASGLALWGWLRPEPAPTVSRYALAFAPQEAPVGMMQLSRSGALLVYGGTRVGATRATADPATGQLWMKARDRAEPVPIPGTVGVSGFAISPDEQSVATTSGVALTATQLKRQPIAGGPTVTLADSVLVVGHAWLDDGTIVFSRPAAGGAASLWRVPANGGPAAHLWTPDSAAVPALPSPLPGSRGVLVTRILGTRPAVWIVEVPSGKARRVIDDALFAMFVPPGHLVFGRADGALLAVPFDLNALVVRGMPVPLMDGVEVLGGVVPQFTASLDGTLIVQSHGAGGLNAWNAVWVDRSGRQEVIDSAWRFNPVTSDQNVGWALSPGGERLALGLSKNGNADIFVKQLPSGPLTRITFDSLPDVRPRWTPDGRAITYVSGALGSRRLHQRNADGSGTDTVLLSHSASVLEGAWSMDRRWLLARVGEGASREILGLRPGSDTAPVPLVAGKNVHESAVALSPDSRWLAYESNEAGASEVFIRPFPNTDPGKSQVSTNGGFAPLWSRDGREQFYVSPRREMMAVTVGPGGRPHSSVNGVCCSRCRQTSGVVSPSGTRHTTSVPTARASSWCAALPVTTRRCA